MAKDELREERLGCCFSTARNPEARPTHPFGVGLPGSQDPQPKSIWGRGGSEGNDTKIHPLRKKARQLDLLATVEEPRAGSE